MNASPSTPALYPDDEWHPDLSDRHLPSSVLAEHRVFDLYTTRLDPWPSEKTSEECAALLRLQDMRTDADRQTILYEARGSFGAVTPVLMSIGISTDHPPRPELKKLRDSVVDSANCEVFRWKRHFLRPRPWHLCQKLDPMFFDTNTSHLRPLHASYPSGHSTLAHLFALLLLQVFPGKQQALTEAAGKVAKNREMAGVHFSSDSDAGARLAGQIFERMKAHPRWSTDVLPVLKGLQDIEAVEQRGLRT